MSKLYIVPTPIGNMLDITYRAVEVLKEVELILAEDTRQTGKLLKAYDIDTPQKSFHQHNEHKVLERTIDWIKSNAATALVSDAGTPGISDPGFLLVRKCVDMGIEVECLPGATAMIPALVESGLPSDSFYFLGFLPVKKGRKKKIEYLRTLDKTLVLYESPHRIKKTIDELSKVLGGSRRASLSREISKIHHETIRGTLEDLNEMLATKSIKGEMVLVLEGDN